MQTNIRDFCTPDESYHGITYAEKFGKEGAFITKCTAQLMRDFGSMQSPQNAFILNLGLESLHVRMPKHVENGQAVAEFLEAHPKVAYVNYPGLPSNKYYERAQKYLPERRMWSGIVWIKRWKRSSVYIYEDIKAWCDRDACSRCKNLLSESGNVYTQTDDG